MVLYGGEYFFSCDFAGRYADFLRVDFGHYVRKRLRNGNQCGNIKARTIEFTQILQIRYVVGCEKRWLIIILKKYEA